MTKSKFTKWGQNSNDLHVEDDFERGEWSAEFFIFKFCWLFLNEDDEELWLGVSWTEENFLLIEWLFAWFLINFWLVLYIYY